MPARALPLPLTALFWVPTPALLPRASCKQWIASCTHGSEPCTGSHVPQWENLRPLDLTLSAPTPRLSPSHSHAPDLIFAGDTFTPALSPRVPSPPGSTPVAAASSVQHCHLPSTHCQAHLRDAVYLHVQFFFFKMKTHSSMLSYCLILFSTVYRANTLSSCSLPGAVLAKSWHQRNE